MASTTLTGSYSGSNASNYGIRCVCSSTSNGSAANTSNVTVTLQMRRAVNTGYEGQWSADGTATGRIIINGSDSGTSAVYFDTRDTLDWITLKTYTVKNIPHNADGSKTIAIKAYFEPNATSSLYGGVVSGNFVLDTIPRASTVTATDAYIEGNPTITITRAAATFVHTLYWGTGTTQPSTWTKIVDKTTSISYSSWAIPSSVYALCKNAQKYQYVWIRCDTYASSSATSVIGTKYAKLTANVNPDTNKPNLTVTWSNTDHSSLTGNAETLIRYVSSVTANMTWSAKNQATISSAQMMCTDGQYQTVSPATINNVGANTFIAKVTDSRNLSTEITKTYTMINYVIPSITVVASRPQPTTGEVKLSVSGVCFNGTFGSVANTLTLVYRYKEKGTSTWGSWKSGLTATLSGDTYTANSTLTETFDYTKAFDFQVNVSDKINTQTGSASVAQGIPLFDWGKEDFKFHVKTDVNSKYFGAMSVTRNDSTQGATIKFANTNGTLGFVGMTNTADSGLMRWNAASSVAYTVLDTGNIGDYVVEQGTSGNWKYRKWNSGIAECWVILTGSSTKYATGGGEGYRHALTVNYPFTFTANPVVTATAQMGTGLSVVDRVVLYKDKVTIGINSNLATSGYTISVFVIGNWK